MVKPRLGLWDYVKGAFNARVHTKKLGGLPVNWLALAGGAVAGVAVPALIPIGLGLELAYLTILAHNPRFRKVVDGQHVARDAGHWEHRKRALAAALTPESEGRLDALEQRVEEIGQLTDADAGALARLRQGSVQRLVWIYLRLLRSKEVLTTQIDGKARDRVELDIRRQSKRLSELADNGSPAVRRSVKATIEILERRRDNLAAAADKLAYIDAELVRIEQQVELLIEEAALSRDAGEMSDRLDAVTSTLDDTNAWMAANAEILGDVADELDAPPLALENPMSEG